MPKSICYKLFRYSNIYEVGRIFCKVIAKIEYNTFFSIIVMKLICQFGSAFFSNEKIERLFIAAIIGLKIWDGK